MNRSRIWFVLVLVASVLLSGSSSPALPGKRAKITPIAPLGAELAALASASSFPKPRQDGRMASYLSRIPQRMPAPEQTQPPPPTPAQVPSPEPSQTPMPEPTQAPPPTPRPPAAKKGKLIFVDAGHGGYDSGAVHTGRDGRIDLMEKEVNLWIALKLAEMLRQDGYDVHLSRSIDSFMVPGGSTPIELQTRVDEANRVGADLLVSIHHNGSLNSSLRGTEVYYCGHRGFASNNRRLAWLVQQGLVRNLRQAGYETVDRGIKDEAFLGHFALLGPHMPRTSRMPGILGEALFVSNDADAAALRRADIREAIARGYLEGIKAYFGDD